MLNCKQTSHLVSQSLDRKLSTREKFAIRLHLLICKYCKRFNQQLNTIRLSLGRMRNDIENDRNIQLPSETKARIAQALKSAAKQ